MTRVLGIDPGSRVTGFGVVDQVGHAYRYVDSGVIRTGSGSFPERLRVIYDDLAELITRHRPDVMVVEDVFVQRNASAALKLGQARGAAICAGVTRGLTVAEYDPRSIKQALVGRGGADKAQVQYMVCRLLDVQSPLAEDAGDALAAALCHVHQAGLQGRLREAAANQWGGNGS